MPIFCQIHFGLAFPKLSLRSENYILQNTDENLLKLNCSENGWITAYPKKSLHFQGNTTAYIATQQLLVHDCPFTSSNFFKKQNTVKSPAIYLVLKYISSQFEKSLCPLFYGKSARGWIPILTSRELFRIFWIPHSVSVFGWPVLQLQSVIVPSKLSCQGARKAGRAGIGICYLPRQQDFPE